MSRGAGRILAGTAAALVAAGCGGGDDEPEGANASRFEGERAKVAQVVDDLQSAARDGDGDRICEELFTENLRISVQRASRRSCAEEVASNLETDEATFQVDGIELRRNSAVARVVDERDRRSSLVFLREGGDWRIARIGRLGGA